jgi:pRiA4b ORF-3-like protein
MANSHVHRKIVEAFPDSMTLVEALADPNHERHEEMLDWIGDDFDPQAFSVDKVNKMLAPLSRHRRKTSQG